MKSSIVCLLWSAFAVLLTAAVIMMYEDANHFIRWSTATTTATTMPAPPPLKSSELIVGIRRTPQPQLRSSFDVDDLNNKNSATTTTVGGKVIRSNTTSSLSSTDAAAGRKVSHDYSSENNDDDSSSVVVHNHSVEKGTLPNIRDHVLVATNSAAATTSKNGTTVDSSPRTASLSLSLSSSLLGSNSNYTEDEAPHQAVQSTESTTPISQQAKAVVVRGEESIIAAADSSVQMLESVSERSVIPPTPPRDDTSLFDGSHAGVGDVPKPVGSVDDYPARTRSSINPSNNGSTTIPSTTKMGAKGAKAVSSRSVVTSQPSPRGSTTGIPENKSTVAIVATPPPLSSLVRGKSVIGDVSGLLDFAIVGFPKSGTSSLLEWLEAHPDVQMAPGEYMELYAVGRDDGLSNFVRYFHQRYLERPSCSSCRRGYKNPRELYEYGGMGKIERYFYKTKIVVALRHPVTWFQSFHNYRTSSDGDGWNGWGCPVEEQELLTMNCTRGVDLCIEHTKFHSYLYRLGKTHGQPEERELMIHDSILPRRPFSTGQVFVFEVSQLSDPGTTLDISNFLGLEHPLRPGPKNNVGFVSTFDICQDRYDRLRERLLGIAVNASAWIRNYFLHSPDVVVSSRERFEELLLGWKEDPCQKKKNNQ